MEGWQIGLIVMMAVGVAVILFGALWDRARTQRREREMLSPPARTIPEFHPETPAPHYLSELAARRTTPASEEALDEATRGRLREAVDTAEPVAAGYAGPDFVTDSPTGWAVLRRPRVLVCGQAVATIRELLPALESVQLSQHPLVIVAPDFEPAVLSTLKVNRLRHLIDILAIRAPGGVRDAIIDRCGGAPVEWSDLRAGYLPEAAYGSIGWWISDARHSWLLGEDATPVT